jgi:hypothetical protein
MIDSIDRIKRTLAAKGVNVHTVEGAFEITKRFAWEQRHAGTGLLLKPGGDNIVEWKGRFFSAGRICYPDGHIVKILTDIPTTNGPSWQDEGEFVATSRYVAAMDPGGDEPAAPPAPPPRPPPPPRESVGSAGPAGRVECDRAKPGRRRHRARGAAASAAARAVRLDVPAVKTFSAPLLIREIEGDDDRWLLEEACIYFYGLEWIEAPKGFITNFGSIPPPFCWMRGLSRNGKYRKAYAIHDKLYEAPVVRTATSARAIPKAECDAILIEMMTVLGAGTMTLFTIRKGLQTETSQKIWDRYRAADLAHAQRRE